MSDAGRRLADSLEQSDREERRRALRALLMRPLLHPGDPEFPLVRRHAAALGAWLREETGWRLLVELDFIRLAKTPVDPADGTRPARSGPRPGDPPFTRRRYALFCLALAELGRSEAQITLGRLGERLRDAATAPELIAAGLEFDLQGRDQRRDLVEVVRLLLRLGVLSRVAGDEAAYLEQRGDALYDVARRLIAGLYAGTRGPSLVELDPDPPNDAAARLAAITRRYRPSQREARNRRLRQDLTARLLDDPVLYYSELEPDTRTYLINQRSALLSRIEAATGLLPEVRAEGIALVDPESRLSDRPLPGEGTEGHVTLLVAGWLGARLSHGEETTPLTEIQERIRAWAKEYHRYWRKAAREPGAEVELAVIALDHLEALRLVDRQGDRVRALPALARYRPEEKE